MAISTVKNVRVILESGVRWYHFEADIDEDSGSDYYGFKMQKGGDNSSNVMRTSVGGSALAALVSSEEDYTPTTYATGSAGDTVWAKLCQWGVDNNKEWIGL